MTATGDGRVDFSVSPNEAEKKAAEFSPAQLRLLKVIKALGLTRPAQRLYARLIGDKAINVFYRPPVDETVPLLELKDAPRRYGVSPFDFYAVASEPLAAAERPIVLSFGVGIDASFDRVLIDRFGAKVYAFDPTPLSAQYVATQTAAGVLDPASYVFRPQGVFDEDTVVDFHVSDDIAGIDSVDPILGVTKTIQVEMRRLSTILKELGLTAADVDLLKIDIKGSEYPLFEDLFNTGEPALEFKQIVIQLNGVFYDGGAAADEEIIRRIREAGYKVVYASKKKDPEVTLVRG